MYDNFNPFLVFPMLIALTIMVTISVWPPAKKWLQGLEGRLRDFSLTLGMFDDSVAKSPFFAQWIWTLYIWASAWFLYTADHLLFYLLVMPFLALRSLQYVIAYGNSSVRSEEDRLKYLDVLDRIVVEFHEYDKKTLQGITKRYEEEVARQIKLSVDMKQLGLKFDKQNLETCKSMLQLIIGLKVKGS